VSFGTVASPRPDELRELAAGLEASGAPFLWSLREDSWPLLPPGFLDRATSTGSGLVVPWAPQVPVLRHPSVGVFAKPTQTTEPRLRRDCSGAGWALGLFFMRKIDLRG